MQELSSSLYFPTSICLSKIPLEYDIRGPHPHYKRPTGLNYLWCNTPPLDGLHNLKACFRCQIPILTIHFCSILTQILLLAACTFPGSCQGHILSSCFPSHGSLPMRPKFPLIKHLTPSSSARLDGKLKSSFQSHWLPKINSSFST